MKELITKLNFESVVHQVADSSLIFYCAPGITKEIGNVLLQLANSNHELFIICDLDVQNDYRGMNEIEELKKLNDLKNVLIKNSKGINVSLISDLSDFNYFLFPVSKIFKSEPEGYNAVAFDGFLALSLFTQFFPDVIAKSPVEFEALLNKQKEIGIETLNEIKNPMENLQSIALKTEPISIEQIKRIQKTVKEFPPEKPDIQRQINFINNYIQVVDLKFEGANWQSTRVTIPQKLIPFKSEELQKNLDSKLKIFSKDDEAESLKDFNDLKKEVEALRKEYLFRSKLRDKSIIKLNEKEAFKLKVEELKKKVEAFKESLFETVNAQIEKAEKAIPEELIKFYLEDPPKDLKQYKEQSSFEKRVIADVNVLMKDVRFPTATEVIGELKLTLSFLNFTYEDFEDEKFLTELSEWDKLSPEEYFKLFEKRKGFEIQKN